jgi:hypothetical protein
VSAFPGVVVARAMSDKINLFPSAPVEEVSDEETGDIPFRDAPEEATNGDRDAEEEDDDDDEEEDEDV